MRGIDNMRSMDAFEFVRLAGEASGEVAISALARFAEGMPGQAGGSDGMLHWSARGERDVHGKSFLHLHVRGAPIVECQRCLAPFAWPVDSDVTLELVASEAELDADAPEGEDDPESPEKVLGSRRFDLLSHVEDELILAVPYITRHPVCPDLPQALKEQPPVEEERRPSPFAALEKLKNK